jgi:5-methylcytosine-specific restriction endonuclease McrA
MGTGNGASAFWTKDAKDAGDWKLAHAALSRLARERAALDAEEGRWLLRALRSAAHVHLGFGSFAEYIERLFGHRPRTTREKLRVAEALETLPRLGRALETGALSWCAARELTRVAVPETEPAWLDAARGKTLRELEALVASKAPGDEPHEPATEPPRPRVLRFEVAPDTFATFREAMLRLRRQAGDSLDDDAVLLAMARQVLGGPGDEGRSSYQISLSVCGVCSAGAQAAAGELVPVDAAVVDMAKCDGQHLGQLLPLAAAPGPANENASLDAAPTGGADRRTHDAPAEPNDESSATFQSSDHAHVGTESRRESGATDATPPQRAAGAESRRESDATDATPPQRAANAEVRPSRARQSVPPALRRAVLTRDRHRCTVPGCTHATFVDVHHVQPRSEGGHNEASNLLTLCSAHHRAAHRGELLVDRERDGSLRFRHADGAAYGDPLMPQRIDAHAKVFSALRHLGFRESEVKIVLSELRADAELREASVEHLLHAALCRIRPTAR